MTDLTWKEDMKLKLSDSVQININLKTGFFIPARSNCICLHPGF